ncbi:MAG: beta-ketoacyl synthase N-terminal-like domain-containing protein [Gammaproteobacteria bacterium]|nr:beta-ketoacyl synthase N-terminal-like domain-containing protein [Gammaproteobacteria bacterium]
METLNTAIYVRAPIALGRRYTFRATPHSATPDPFEQSVVDSVQELCGQQLRQASRFIRLAAAGALRCAQRAALPASSGLYLATGLGDHNTAARLFAQSHLGQGRASPFDFVNVNSNTASYYIARMAGLKGPNLTISQGALSYEWALRLAMTAVCAGLTYALVGGVDERAVTRQELKRRFRRGRGQPPGEGSGWLVLTPDRCHAHARLLEMRWLENPHTADWRAIGGRWAQLAGARTLYLSTGPGVRRQPVTALMRDLPNAVPWPYLVRCGHYPTAAAFGIAESLGGAGPASGLWAHVSAGQRGQFVLTLWERVDHDTPLPQGPEERASFTACALYSGV